MSAIKTTIKSIYDAKSLTDKNKIFNSTQDVFDNFERVVFDDYAIAIGDLDIEITPSRPIGFTKRMVTVELVLLIKKKSHEGLDEHLHLISELLWISEIENSVQNKIISWSPETKLNDAVTYTIGTCEIIQFISV